MMAVVRRLLLVSALLATTALTACGTGPTSAPGVSRPQLDPSGEPIALAGGGSVDMPASWTITPGPAGGPEMARATSGQGAIVVWRYPRVEPLPNTQRDLRNTRRSLVAAIQSRDETFKFSAKILRRLPEPAVEVAGVGTLAGARRSIRSLHVYAGGTETVVDCIGPIGDAAKYNETICQPVLQSLDLG